MPIAGRPPSLINLPGGCSFHPRCPYVREAHKRDRPDARPGAGADPGHLVACLLGPRCGTGCGASCVRASAPEEARKPTSMAEEGGGHGTTASTQPVRARAARQAGVASAGETLLEVRDLVKHFPITRGAHLPAPDRRRAGRRRRSRSTSRAARRSAWWASRAAASRPPRGCCCACSMPTSGSIKFDGRGDRATSSGARAQGPAPRRCR